MLKTATKLILGITSFIFGNQSRIASLGIYQVKFCTEVFLVILLLKLLHGLVGLNQSRQPLVYWYNFGFPFVGISTF